MLLTITYTGTKTSDLGYLLYKNPNRPQVFELNYGKAYVFYTEVSEVRTTAALLLEIDPIDLARGKVGSSVGGLFDYVNDRPYVSSSFMSTAISRVFGTAMTGRADAHQSLADSTLNLSATITMLPCKSDKEMLYRIFEPLGYEVSYETYISDEVFPSWGDCKYVNLTIKGNVRLQELLHHIYVLIPVFDRQKHYWVGKEEVEKLLRHSEEWLKNHPEKAFITGRYLNRSRALVNLAFSRLSSENDQLFSEESGDSTTDLNINTFSGSEEKMNLNAQRLGSVVAAAKTCGAKNVIDLGCGDGKLLALLRKENQFQNISGMDVSYAVLEKAKNRLKFDKMSESAKERIQIFQSSLTYKDKRFKGFDVACVVEVIEHLDISRLTAFERVLFEYAKPKTIILTTPNKEYNENYKGLANGELRHGDHRFEWTRSEFRKWATEVSDKYGYQVVYSAIGEMDHKFGSPTQMGVFSRCE